MNAPKANRAAVETAFWDKHVGVRRRKWFRRNWYTQTNRYLWSYTMEEVGDLTGQRVLLVGCGEAATVAKEMARRGGHVWCLDISAGSIEKFMQHPFEDLAERIHPVVGDAEKMPFDAGSFDVVVGKAIVHHLDIGKFMRELTRVCVPGARVIFCEPLGTNPAINLFRRLTPSLRVPTEHPLRQADIKLIRSHCEQLTSRHCEFLTALSFPWFFLGAARVGHLVHRISRAMESAIFRAIPPTRWLAWAVILAGRLSSPNREDKA